MADALVALAPLSVAPGRVPSRRHAAGWAGSMAASLGLLGASMHPALPRSRAPGPAVRLSGFAPGESVEPVGVLGPHAFRKTNKKAAPGGGLFICLAERGAASPIIHSMSAHFTYCSMCMIFRETIVSFRLTPYHPTAPSPVCKDDGKMRNAQLWRRVVQCQKKQRK